MAQVQTADCLQDTRTRAYVHGRRRTTDYADLVMSSTGSPPVESGCAHSGQEGTTDERVDQDQDDDSTRAQLLSKKKKKNNAPTAADDTRRHCDNIVMRKNTIRERVSTRLGTRNAMGSLQTCGERVRFSFDLSGRRLRLDPPHDQRRGEGRGGDVRRMYG